MEFSREPMLLDTGGGLKKAAWFFDDKQPFILHNVDVISDLDLAEMYRSHLQGGQAVTIAVRQRKTSRYFLFDDDDLLVGWRSAADEQTILTRQTPAPLRELSFMGIHIISPHVFEYFPDQQIFSIKDLYFSLSARGREVKAYLAQNCHWKDLGTPQRYEEGIKYIQNLKADRNPRGE
jgi:NDP-sugar pyrophosphorylase family protein